MEKIKKWRHGPQHNARGQGLVEFALVLPILVLLLLGVTEMGFALYNYMTLATANREGVRLASRARFTDDMVSNLVVSSGGLVERADGTFEPNMRLLGEDSNLGVIITHIYIDPDGNLLDSTTYVTGTIAHSGGERQFITPEDSGLTDDILAELIENSSNTTSEINTYREGLMYETINDEVVIVETFLAHDFITPVLESSTINLYFHSTMRVLRDSRIQ